MNDRGPERGPSNRLRFEDEAEDMTSGQLGPKSPRKEKPQKKPPEPDSRRLRFEDEEAPGGSQTPGTSGQVGPKLKKDADSKPGSKLRQDRDKSRPSERLRRDDEAPPPDADDPGDGGAAPDADTPNPKADKKTAREQKKFDKSGRRADKTGAKLDKAKDKLAAQKPIKKPGPIKTVRQGAQFEAWRYVHGKIHQVEDENVGVEAAHRTELAGESVLRGGTRFVKHRNRTRPARRVSKWEKCDIKAKADFQFRKLAQEHPEIKDNVLSRHFQKQRIKKQYQKQAREAAKKGAAKAAKETARTTEKLGRAVVNFVKRHPVAALVIVLCFLLVVTLQSCMGGLLTIGNGLTGSVAASTYPSEDAEMLAAEAAYTGMEADLQYELDHYASLHPSYDEYHYDLDTIEHDPYVLISILSAMSDGAWTLGEVQGRLSMLFTKQYILTETVVVEVRYYTEYWSYTDPETGETDSGSYEVPYNYYICYITLENFNLSHVPIHIMDEDSLSKYALYMATLGNRPDLFPLHLYPYASTYKDYGRYDIPPEYLEDEIFAAIIAEAEKYLGFPYVWGGYSPATSFDCSGYVSWVLNHSGWNIGRLGAQGLYNMCTPVSSANARPGDLIFFVGTYDTPGVSHVGIYVGDGMMLHCGDPIGYTSINTSYWQSHFYSFGRP